MSLEHDDLYARAWECEYEKPILDAEKNDATPPNLPEIPKQTDLSSEETWNTTGKAQQCSREKFPETDDLFDVTDTYPDMEPDVETSSEHPINCPTNPRSSNFHRRPRNSKSVSRNQYVEFERFLLYTELVVPWTLTHLLLSLDYFETRPLKLTSTILLFFSTQAGFNSFNFYYFLLFPDYPITLYIRIHD